MKNRINLIVMILLILATFLSIVGYLNVKENKVDIINYQIELSKKSIHTLQLTRLETVNFKVVLKEFSNSIKNALPFSQIRTFKQRNYVKTILSKGDDELKESDKQLITNYRRYLENKDFSSSISQVYEVEISLLLASISAYILLFIFFYKFIPKLFTNNGYKTTYIRYFVFLNVLTFVIYQMNINAEKEIGSGVKSNFNYENSMEKKDNGLNLKSHKFNFVEFECSDEWIVTYKEIEKDFLISIECINKKSNSVLSLIISNNKSDTIEWINIMKNNLVKQLQNSEFGDIHNMIYLNHNTVFVDFSYLEDKRFGKIISFQTKKKTVVIIKQANDITQLVSEFNYIEKTLKFK